MEIIFGRFPGLGEAVLRNINDEGLVKIRKVNLRWKDFIDRQKTIWIRKIEKKIGKRDTFSDDWKKAVFKTPAPMVRELAINVEKFFKIYRGEIFSPLFIAAQQDNLVLT